MTDFLSSESDWMNNNNTNNGIRNRKETQLVKTRTTRLFLLFHSFFFVFVFLCSVLFFNLSFWAKPLKQAAQPSHFFHGDSTKAWLRCECRNRDLRRTHHTQNKKSNCFRDYFPTFSSSMPHCCLGFSLGCHPKTQRKEERILLHDHLMLLLFQIYIFHRLAVVVVSS